MGLGSDFRDVVEATKRPRKAKLDGSTSVDKQSLSENELWQRNEIRLLLLLFSVTINQLQ